MDVKFDLLGDPIPEGHGKRGRPAHVATDEKRRLIIQLQAFGWSVERMSAALSITPPTLRKNYFRELKARAESRARVEAKLLGEMMALAEDGNVQAIDKYLKRLEKHDQAVLQDRVDGATVFRSPEAKLGKKELRQKAADAAAGKYAVPSGPRLVN